MINGPRQPNRFTPTARKPVVAQKVKAKKKKVEAPDQAAYGKYLKEKWARRRQGQL